MAKFCPVSGRYALYLECQECDEKEKCRKDNNYGRKKKEDGEFDTGARGTVQRGKKESAADT